MQSDAEARVRATVQELADALIALVREQAASGATAAVELVSVAEFARRAGISRSTAYLAAGSTLRTIRIRGRRLVPVSELGRLADAASPAQEAAGHHTKRSAVPPQTALLEADRADRPTPPPAS